MTAPASSERICSVCEFDPGNPDEGDGTVQDCLVPECPLRKPTTPTSPQYSALAADVHDLAQSYAEGGYPRSLLEYAATALRAAEALSRTFKTEQELPAGAYLKEGESVLERLERFHKEVSSLVGLLAKERAKTEALEQRVRELKRDLITLGRDSYSAVQGWYPEDFTEEEGLFTVERAVEAIQVEQKYGREAHQKYCAAKTAVAKAEQRVAELTDTSLTAYWKREAERREDWRPLVQPQVDAAVAKAQKELADERFHHAECERLLGERIAEGAKAREGALEDAAIFVAGFLSRVRQLGGETGEINEEQLLEGVRALSSRTGGRS